MSEAVQATKARNVKSFSICLLGVGLGLNLTLNMGCLRTRGAVRETDQKQVMQEQVTTLQLKNADSTARLSETQEALREVSGRLLNLENRMEQMLKSGESQNSVALEQNQALKRQVDLLQQEVIQLQTSIQTLQQDHAAAKSSSSSASDSGSKNKGSSKSGTYDEAEEYFKNKDWKRAIVTFQKFREESPKSSRVPEAIYKIGVSFQELGLKDEARAFYDEAIAKFPQSEGARKSRLRLRSLK